MRASLCRTTGPPKISSPRERSWPAIFWDRAMLPAWAWPLARSSAALPAGRRPKLPSSETEQQARRFVEICNACRYCEGYCAVFPAIELRRQFTRGDLSYLANLCHDCRGCYYSCQYAPPHEFALNLPRVLAELRLETYERYAWPRPFAALFRRNGIAVSILTFLSIAFFLWLAKPAPSPAIAPAGPGSFYAVVPEGLMVAITGIAFLFALLSLAMGLANFWRDTASLPATDAPALFAAFADVLTLRNLGGAGYGCNN